jgi:hypothetical protein
MSTTTPEPHLHYAGSDWILASDEISPELLQDLLDCGGSGDASNAVDYVMRVYTVTGDEADCRAMLDGYGAWDADQLADHDENLRRLVWLTGCDLHESGEAYFSAY